MNRSLSLIKTDEPVIPEIIPDIADYVRRLDEAYCWTVEGVIRAGMILLEAKTRLNYGEWEGIFRDRMISISKATANKLISISGNPVLAEGSNWSLLPYSWTTLYKLSHIPLNTLQKAIDAGLIFPEMRAKDVKAIMGQKASGPEPFDESQSLKRIKKFLQMESSKWPDSSKAILKREVVKTLDHICR